MRVKFYGTSDAMVSWKKLVEETTKKACTPVVRDPARSSVSCTFIAFIDEKDCEKMMKHWYEVEEGHDLRWNCRVSFTKSR